MNFITSLSVVTKTEIVVKSSITFPHVYLKIHYEEFIYRANITLKQFSFFISAIGISLKY